ncbi:MAG: monophosphatase [Thermoleophilaceae bacterium]|jgi:myo-inositol-1(or 4)-monophosphatase|nr:monophosphatase [Thermoleophilaceae bacterium]MEA2352019.1 monophosphatase [Thermoleophilaceae bacterium]MEA2369119.1 monophosphatase [Thermoleophilaceae bacterium]MEA2389174.1 monophosphatase [Thermoleophilaceae bacterium]
MLVDLVRDLSLALRETVMPMLGSHAGRAHEGDAEAAGGDVTFAIDAEAERMLETFLRERAPDVAYYSEDVGLSQPSTGTASTVLVVDPIDGTRPAMAGLESCCVSVAAAPLRDGVTMGEVSVACIVEIKSGAVFLAERGRGMIESPPVLLSANERLDRMFWTYGFRGRPARALTEVLAELIDASSVGGGTFDLGSAAFDVTRVLTGQLDAYVEPGPLLVDEVPGMRAEFERVGGGAVLNNSPYDLAAAVLCAEEAGAVVTDARGRSLADRPLLGSGAEFQMSIVASANPALHGLILAELAAGIDRLKAPDLG